jgi:hypothetical protein
MSAVQQQHTIVNACLNLCSKHQIIYCPAPETILHSVVVMVNIDDGADIMPGRNMGGMVIRRHGIEGEFSMVVVGR